MIEQHLDDIEKEFVALMRVIKALDDTDSVLGLIPQQRAIIRREMAAYAQATILDSTVALEVESICGQYAGPLKPTPPVHPNVDDDLLRRLDEAGSTGLDLSPGDQLAAEAAAEIRRLSGK